MNKILYLAILSVVFASPAFCDLEHKVREIEKTLNTSEQNQRNLTNDIRRLQRSIDALLGHRQTIEDNQTRTRNELIELQTRTRNELMQLQTQLREELRELRENSGRIGEVRYSILNVEDFQNLYGSSWVLMDGRTVADTALAALGVAKIPDARGVFLRCKNHGVSLRRGNPDGELKIGSYQRDQFAEHTHAAVGQKNSNSKSILWSGGPSWTTTDLSEISQKSSARELRTGSAGGFETRPRCITVNVFIKIHDARNLPTQDEPDDAQAANGNAGDGEERG